MAMKAKLRRMEIEPAENGGHTITHYFPDKATKSGAFRSMPEPTKHVFGPDQHAEMMDHIAEHLGIEHGDREDHDQENVEG